MNAIQKRFESVRQNMIAARVPAYDRSPVSKAGAAGGFAGWVRVPTISGRAAWALFDCDSEAGPKESHCSYQPKWYTEYQRMIISGAGVDPEDESAHETTMHDFIGLFAEAEQAGWFEFETLRLDDSVLPVCAQRVKKYYPPTSDYWAWLIARAKSVLN